MNKSEIEKANIVAIIDAMDPKESQLCKAMIGSLLASVGHPITGKTFMMAVAYVNCEVAVALIRLGLVNEDGTTPKSKPFTKETEDEALDKVVAQMDKPCVNGHVLYEDGDKGMPEQILDRNGQVCLALCKVCGKGEAELDEGACVPKPYPGDGRFSS